jgi:hypothetical protein
MDGPVEIDRSAIESAARNMGIVPGDAAYPFVQLMLQMHDKASAETAAHIAAMKVFTETAEKAAKNSLATAGNKYELRAALGQAIAGQLPAVILSMRFATVAGLLAIGCGLVGAGYWWGSSQVNSAMVTNCAPSPQPSGTAFSCLFWTQPPTRSQH